ncbi:MAG: hypothetical protein A4E40_00278 [Methanoregulaceae archaeon PtaU1.Bin059]|nr:MAG: hypothetical protein A4E40_00278 [Methanoregulaceae archaeon PtaU1.Bin059]
MTVSLMVAAALIAPKRLQVMRGISMVNRELDTTEGYGKGVDVIVTCSRDRTGYRP